MVYNIFVYENRRVGKLKIKEVEEVTGMTAKAIRLYEEKGLVNIARKENSYREYTEENVKELMFIKTLREMGIGISQIKLYINKVLTLEEILDDRKKEMEKENIYHQESYAKCTDLLRKLKSEIKNSDYTSVNKQIENDVICAFDFGTTNIKAIVADCGTNKVCEIYTVPNMSKISCEEGFFEFDSEWFANKTKSILEYFTKIYKNIRCIGITGQMHGILYVSKEGKAVSPFYNWQDRRGNVAFSESKSFCEEITKRTGYSCGSGYGFTTMFYNNVKNLEPKNAKTFCNIADYVVMTLTKEKEPLVHPTMAASFGLYDEKNNCFDKDAVFKLGLSHITLPKIAKECFVAGEYNDIPVCVAIGDNQASFFGSVTNDKNTALVNFGTGSQVSIVTDKIYELDDNLEIRPYLFGKYMICGSALCGGKAYAILEKFFFEYAKAIDENTSSQYEIMNRFAKESYIKKKHLNVFTQFCGTRKNTDLKGSINEISDTNFTPGNLIFGVLAGMVNELKTYFDCMEHSKIKKIVATGNGVKRNEVLQKLLKDIFGFEIEITKNDEEAAIGCALYSGIVCDILDFSQCEKIIKGM